jgi:hypothetical protein
MMKLLGDDVCISRIHGGGEECGLVALSTNNGFVVHNRNLGEHLPERYHLNRCFFQNRTIIDGS